MAMLTNPYSMRLNPNKNPLHEAPKGAGMWLSKKDNLPLPEPIPVNAWTSRIQEASDLEDVEMCPFIVGQSTDKSGYKNTSEQKHSLWQPLIQQWYNVEGLMKLC